MAAAAATVIAQATDNNPPLPLPHHVIAQLPKPSWIENIAVRPNGDLLLTTFSFTTTDVTLYTIPSPSSPSPSIIPLHTFPAISYLFGIAEHPLQPDTFIFAGGNIPSATTPTGSYQLWAVAFPPTHSPNPNPNTNPNTNTNSTPIITPLTPLNKTTLLLPNGLAPIPHQNAILIADSLAGKVIRVDLATGESTIPPGLQAPEMAPSPSQGLSTGINGLKIISPSRDNRNLNLYFTNSATATLYRMGISPDGKTRTRPDIEVVADLKKWMIPPPEGSNATWFADDFALGLGEGAHGDGKVVAWVTTNSENTLIAVDVETGESVVVGGSIGAMDFAGDTAAAFGRIGRGGVKGKGNGDGGSVDDRSVLYVTTCGGQRRPVNNETEGAKVVAVDTTGFSFRR